MLPKRDEHRFQFLSVGLPSWLRPARRLRVKPGPFEQRAETVATQRHAFRSRECVGEESAGHPKRVCDVVEREGFAEMGVQVLLGCTHNAQRRGWSESLRSMAEARTGAA